MPPLRRNTARDGRGTLGLTTVGLVGDFNLPPASPPIQAHGAATAWVVRGGVLQKVAAPGEVGSTPDPVTPPRPTLQQRAQTARRVRSAGPQRMPVLRRIHTVTETPSPPPPASPPPPEVNTHAQHVMNIGNKTRYVLKINNADVKEVLGIVRTGQSGRQQRTTRQRVSSPVDSARGSEVSQRTVSRPASAVVLHMEARQEEATPKDTLMVPAAPPPVLDGGTGGGVLRKAHTPQHSKPGHTPRRRDFQVAGLPRRRPAPRRDLGRDATTSASPSPPGSPPPNMTMASVTAKGGWSPQLPPQVMPAVDAAGPLLPSPTGSDSDTASPRAPVAHTPQPPPQQQQPPPPPQQRQQKQRPTSPPRSTSPPAAGGFTRMESHFRDQIARQAMEGVADAEAAGVPSSSEPSPTAAGRHSATQPPQTVEEKLQTSASDILKLVSDMTREAGEKLAMHGAAARRESGGGGTTLPPVAQATPTPTPPVSGGDGGGGAKRPRTPVADIRVPLVPAGGGGGGGTSAPRPPSASAAAAGVGDPTTGGNAPRRNSSLRSNGSLRSNPRNVGSAGARGGARGSVSGSAVAQATPTPPAAGAGGGGRTKAAPAVDDAALVSAWHVSPGNIPSPVMAADAPCPVPAAALDQQIVEIVACALQEQEQAAAAAKARSGDEHNERERMRPDESIQETPLAAPAGAATTTTAPALLDAAANATSTTPGDTPQQQGTGSGQASMRGTPAAVSPGCPLPAATVETSGEEGRLVDSALGNGGLPRGHEDETLMMLPPVCHGGGEGDVGAGAGVETTACSPSPPAVVSLPPASPKGANVVGEAGAKASAVPTTTAAAGADAAPARPAHTSGLQKEPAAPSATAPTAATAASATASAAAAAADSTKMEDTTLVTAQDDVGVDEVHQGAAGNTPTATVTPTLTAKAVGPMVSAAVRPAVPEAAHATMTTTVTAQDTSRGRPAPTTARKDDAAPPRRASIVLEPEFPTDFSDDHVVDAAPAAEEGQSPSLYVSLSLSQNPSQAPTATNASNALDPPVSLFDASVSELTELVGAAVAATPLPEHLAVPRGARRTESDMSGVVDAAAYDTAAEDAEVAAATAVVPMDTAGDQYPRNNTLTPDVFIPMTESRRVSAVVGLNDSELGDGMSSKVLTAATLRGDAPPTESTWTSDEVARQRVAVTSPDLTSAGSTPATPLPAAAMGRGCTPNVASPAGPGVRKPTTPIPDPSATPTMTAAASPPARRSSSARDILNAVDHAGGFDPEVAMPPSPPKAAAPPGTGTPPAVAAAEKAEFYRRLSQGSPGAPRAGTPGGSMRRGSSVQKTPPPPPPPPPRMNRAESPDFADSIDGGDDVPEQVDVEKAGADAAFGGDWVCFGGDGADSAGGRTSPKAGVSRQNSGTGHAAPPAQDGTNDKMQPYSRPPSAGLYKPTPIPDIELVTNVQVTSPSPAAIAATTAVMKGGLRDRGSCAGDTLDVSRFTPVRSRTPSITPATPKPALSLAAQAAAARRGLMAGTELLDPGSASTGRRVSNVSSASPARRQTLRGPQVTLDGPRRKSASPAQRRSTLRGIALGIARTGSIQSKRSRTRSVSNAGTEATLMASTAASTLMPGPGAGARRVSVVSSRATSMRRGSSLNMADDTPQFLRSKEWRRRAHTYGFSREVAPVQSRQNWYGTPNDLPRAANDLLSYTPDSDPVRTTDEWTRWVSHRRQNAFHAVVLCVGRYDDASIPPVHEAAGDGAALEKVLKTANYSVDLLSDVAGAAHDFLEPTRANFLRVLHLALKRAKMVDLPEMEVVGGDADTKNDRGRLKKTPQVLVYIIARGAEGELGFLPQMAAKGARLVFTKEASAISDRSLAGIVHLSALLNLRDAFDRRPHVICDVHPCAGGIQALPITSGFGCIFGCNEGNAELDAVYPKGHHGILTYYMLKGVSGKVGHATSTTLGAMCAYAAERLSKLRVHCHSDSSHLASNARLLVEREGTAAGKTALRRYQATGRWQACRFCVTAEVPLSSSPVVAEFNTKVGKLHMQMRHAMLHELCRLLYRSNGTPKKETVHTGFLRFISLVSQRTLVLRMTTSLHATTEGITRWKEALQKYVKNYTFDVPAPVTDFVICRAGQYVQVHCANNEVVRAFAAEIATGKQLLGRDIASAGVLCDITFTGNRRDMDKIGKMRRVDALASTAHPVVIRDITELEDEGEQIMATVVQSVWQGYKTRRWFKTLGVLLYEEAACARMLREEEAKAVLVLHERYRAGRQGVLYTFEKYGRQNVVEWEREELAELWKRFITAYGGMIANPGHPRNVGKTLRLIHKNPRGVSTSMNVSRGVVEVLEFLDRVFLDAMQGQLEIMREFWSGSIYRLEQLQKAELWGRYNVLNDEYAERLNMLRLGQSLGRFGATGLRVERSYRPAVPVGTMQEHPIGEMIHLEGQEVTARQVIVGQEIGNRVVLTNHTEWFRTEIARLQRLQAERRREDAQDPFEHFARPDKFDPDRLIAEREVDEEMLERDYQEARMMTLASSNNSMRRGSTAWQSAARKSVATADVVRRFSRAAGPTENLDYDTLRRQIDEDRNPSAEFLARKRRSEAAERLMLDQPALTGTVSRASQMLHRMSVMKALERDGVSAEAREGIMDRIDSRRQSAAGATPDAGPSPPLSGGGRRVSLASTYTPGAPPVPTRRQSVAQSSTERRLSQSQSMIRRGSKVTFSHGNR